MTTQESEVKNSENIHVSVEKQEGCQVKFTVSVEPKAVDAAYSKAVKAINKEVSIPGFRKGKTPEALIKERYPAEIEKEMRDIVLQVAFTEATHLTDIYPLREGSIKRPNIQKCSQSEGAQFTIEFETRPTVPSIDINAIQVKKTSLAPVTPDKIEHALNNLRFHYSEWEEVHGRPVEAGDFVNLDVDVLAEPQHQMMNDTRVGVNEEQMPKWLIDLVIGLQAGESKEGINPEQPNNIPLRVTVNSIWKAIQPNIDDDFAKKLGMQTAEELKEKVIHRLEQNSKREHELKEFKELESFLLDNYAFDLPKSYIVAETKNRMEHHVEKLRQAKYTEKDIHEHLKEIEDSLKKEAIRQLQIYFLFHKLAAEHHIELTGDDITQELSNQIALMSTGESEVNFQEKDMREHIQAIALNKKIKNFLLSKATFT